MDRLQNENNPNVPNCYQISRAVRLYGAGCTAPEFIDAFAVELNEEGCFLAWHAAKAFFAVDEKMSSFHARQKQKHEAYVNDCFDEVMKMAEKNLRG